MSLALGFSPRFAVYIVLRCVARPEYLIRRYATRRSCDTVQFTPDFSQGLKLGSSFNPSSRFQHLDVTTQQAAEQRTELSPGRVCEPLGGQAINLGSCGAARESICRDIQRSITSAFCVKRFNRRAAAPKYVRTYPRARRLVLGLALSAAPQLVEPPPNLLYLQGKGLLLVVYLFERKVVSRAG